MSAPETVREHMTPDRMSNGYKLAIAIENCWDENDRLSRALPDLNERIEANIRRVMDDFGLNLAEWHLWCRYVGGAL